MFQGVTSPKSNKSWEYEVIEMKKQLMKRGILGFPLGIALGFVIPIVISAYVGDGSFYPVTPALIAAIGNELHAVMLQTALCGIIGSVFAIASLIWKLDAWSLAKQSGVYFAIACIVMLPIAYVAGWMQHSIKGVLFYVGIFLAIFVFVWLIQYFAWRSNIKKMNAGVKNSSDRNDGNGV